MAAFKDNQGATRHAMSKEQLEKLYRDFEKFIEDSTFEEVDENRYEITKVKTMIAMRIRKN